MKTFFSDEAVELDILKQRAFNLRWATVPEGTIALTAADPDFPCAPEIRNAIMDYTKSGYFSYGPPEGLPSFRKTVAEGLETRRGIQGSSKQVIPTNSAAYAMFLIAKYVLEPGDEVIIFDPVDFLFKKSVESAGGTPVYCPIEKSFATFNREELRSLVTPKTKMIAVCNPHNPLGHVLTRDELQFIADLAEEHDLYIMSDEIWSDIVFPPAEYISLASLSKEAAKRTFTVYGFSKTFGLAGLRLGFVHCPTEEIAEEVLELSEMRTTAYGVTTLSQIAGEAAWKHAWYYVDEFLEHLTEVRDIAYNWLNAIPGVDCRKPYGTYLMFPDISSFGKTSTEMADYLMKEAKVAVVPGAAKWFGPGAEGHIRICFSTSKKILMEGLDRIEQALVKL